MTGDDGEVQTSPCQMIPEKGPRETAQDTATTASQATTAATRDTTATAPRDIAATASQECSSDDEEVTVVVTLKHVSEVPDNVTDIQVLELDSKSPYIQVFIN